MKALDWKLGVKGPAYVDGLPKGSLPLGLGVRDFCRVNRIAPGGKVMREAQKVARERGNRLVWLEDLRTAQGVDLNEVIASTKRIRGTQARARYAADRAVREDAAAAKRKVAADKRAARKAAKASA